MAVYMITYDLHDSPAQKYEDLISKIKSCSSMRCSYWESSYLIKSSLSTERIADTLNSILDADDTLIVIEVKPNFNGWLEDKDWEYIKKMFS